MRKKVTLAIIYENRERILLQLRDFKERISHPGEWSLFGGSMKSNEFPEEAVTRELKEELDFSTGHFVYFREYLYEEEDARIHVFSCCTSLSHERLSLKEGLEFGFFCFDEIMSGKLFSERLRSKYQVTDLAVRIISDFFSKTDIKQHNSVKAAVLYKTGQPLVVEEDIEIPELQPGQVLVKVAFSGVCHSQLMEVRGKRGEDRYLPHMLGHEGSGTVLEIGQGVTKAKRGDKVILGWIKGSGMDVPGTKYKKNNITINAGGVTTFSNYTVVSENRCIRLPDGIPMDVAVLFGCAIPTGAGIVVNRIKPKKGASVAIFGLGGIGLSALIATQLYKCSMVIAVDVEDDKLNLAKDFGATHIINSAKQDPVNGIARITEGKGVDYSIEAAGKTKSIEAAFQVVRKFGGCCVFASHPDAGEKIEIDPYDLICGKNIEGSWGGSTNPDLDIPKLASLYSKKKLPLEKFLSHKYKLEQINNALDDLENRKIVRALIEMDN